MTSTFPLDSKTDWDFSKHKWGCGFPRFLKSVMRERDDLDRLWMTRSLFFEAYGRELLFQCSLTFY